MPDRVPELLRNLEQEVLLRDGSEDPGVEPSAGIGRGHEKGEAIREILETAKARATALRRSSSDLGEPNGFCARSVCGFRKHRLPRREVGIEATMREACVLHDVRNARSAESIAPDGTRRRRHDALMA